MYKIVIIGAVAAVAATLAVGGVSAAAWADSGSDDVSTAAGTKATPAVSRDRAVKIAVARVPGSHATESDLDRENGVLIWEVDLLRANVEYEVDVDATTGAVRKVDREHDTADRTSSGRTPDDRSRDDRSRDSSTDDDSSTDRD